MQAIQISVGITGGVGGSTPSSCNQPPILSSMLTLGQRTLYSSISLADTNSLATYRQCMLCMKHGHRQHG